MQTMGWASVNVGRKAVLTAHNLGALTITPGHFWVGQGSPPLITAVLLYGGGNHQLAQRCQLGTELIDHLPHTQAQDDTKDRAHHDIIPFAASHHHPLCVFVSE